MICLGIESTAHTFGCGIVSDRKEILANARDVYTTTKGGIIPAQAAEHHVECFDRVIKEALDKAGLSMKDIDLISFSQAPGIGHTLRIGGLAARALAVLHKKPLVGVNHCIAHLEIGRMLTPAKDPMLLYVSGANTQIIAYDGGKYRVFGETLDGGLGNFLDSFSRELGLGFPGGPKIEALAKEGKRYIELPYVVKGMDASFGGILTNVKEKLKSGNYTQEDLCFSLQETVFSILVEAAERAMAHCGKNELLLGGGVACNKRLQEMCRSMCAERGATCFALPNEFNVDNGAMIAWLGIIMRKAGIETPIEKAIIDPYERTDDVVVRWR